MILERLDYSFDAIFTYLVSCRATQRGKFGDTLDRSPIPSEIERCAPKLEEVFNHTQYEAIVYIGKISSGLQPKIPTYQLQSPDAIAKMEYRFYSIKEQAFLLNLFLKDLYDKPSHLSR